MAGFRCSFLNWGQNGHCYQSHPHVVHVHFPAHARLSYYYLYDTCILVEYEKIYPGQEKKSVEVFIGSFEL